VGLPAARRAGGRLRAAGSNPQKLALLRHLGAEVQVAGRDLDEAKDAARATELPFFEDGAEPLQYEAYGAIGDEILEQSRAEPAAVVIPIGNGALAGGVGEAIGRRAPAVRRIGVVAKEMPVMAASYEAGRAVSAPSGSTIADGLAVRVAIPFAVERLRHAVDAVVRVSERAIAEALVASHDAGVAVEPAAAAAVAAVRNLAVEEPAVLVVTGRNVDEAVLDRARRNLASFPA
jgi:threonine dehydratase